ncbi:NAD kinase [Streptococcus plurextorum]|uniref:NAD kinase n=1 Tax=Streptococcus plurextorum TaxID=456876 RepID=UPI000403D126|nr:NAD kinase [Streptococcus plurextorum]
MTPMNFTDSKKVAIIANGKPQSRRVADKIFKALMNDPDFYLTKKNPDIVISIGGDGMLLSAFHSYEKELSRVRFVGVHTGHLGFYTDYRDFEVDELLQNLREDTGEKVSYPILKVSLTLADGRVITSLALNEATIKRMEKTMVADVLVNHVPLEQFRGDGLAVSTPTGSTAYNKSLGGAILHPTIEALQLTEIASLNNRVYRTLGSSIIVPKKDKIEIIPKRAGSYVLTIDNKTYHHRNVQSVTYEIDSDKISFVATPRHTSFWLRVKEAFIGEDHEI